VIVDTTQYFREMKAKKAKFGFQGIISGSEPSILTTAEIIKICRSIEPDANLVIDMDKRTVTLYTESENTANLIRTHHCWKAL
jgi:hypothetical protein